MASLNRYTTIALATTCVISTFLTHSFAQEKTERDPWFTQEHERPEPKEEEKPSITTNNKRENAPTIVLKHNKPASLARKIKKTLTGIPEDNLQKRITLLEEIVSTSKPKNEDLELLKQLRKTRSLAIEAIEFAGNAENSISKSIEQLGAYSPYYKADPSLLIAVLGSEFSERLTRQASTLGRRGENEELTRIESQLREAGLSTIFGQRITQSATRATSSMIARRIEDLSQSSNQLPGEAYLISRMLNQTSGKLRLAIDLPDGADPRLANNITRSIDSQWGEHVQTTSFDKRSTAPELILSIDVKSIHSSNTSNESTIQSTIPGAVVEKENPDFQTVVKRYEKAAKSYQSQLDAFESQYQIYLDQMDDSEYRQAQNDLKGARDRLAATPPPIGQGGSPEYDTAVALVRSSEALANSVSTPMAIEPRPPHPHHLEILDNLYLIPSTLIISEEETNYEYTKQELTFTFESEAPVSLRIPRIENLTTESTVTLNHNRKWTKNQGVHPRDSKVTDGTYSEREYEAALNIFGLKFGSNCSQALTQLFQKAEIQLKTKPGNDSIEKSLLTLALQSVISRTSIAPLTQAELQQLAELAQEQTSTSKEFRAKCLATLLSKTQFAHLSDEETIKTLL